MRLTFCRAESIINEMKDEFCKTKYPILLVHGLGMSDRKGRNPRYWGRIPKALRACGATVFFGGQDAWGTIEGNAVQLAASVRRALAETGSDRINLIAHSRGGLEARYLISTLGYASRIASLTMLSTPNGGSRLAETILRIRPGVTIWARTNDAVWKRRGDDAPALLTVGQQLRRGSMYRFNRDNPDAPGVYYQSWGARLRQGGVDPIMHLCQCAAHGLQGESDGLVTPDSARWGRYRGTLDGVSHQTIVDSFRRDTPHFRPLVFYIKLVHELKESGF